MARLNIKNQYDFYKNICLDENGLICGIEDIVKGLSDIGLLVSGNTFNINGIATDVEEIKNDVSDINKKICPTPKPHPTPRPPITRRKYKPKRKCSTMKNWGGWNIVSNQCY